MESVENNLIKKESDLTNDMVLNNDSPQNSPQLLYLKPRPRVPEIDPTRCLITKTGLRPDYDEYVKPYIEQEDQIPWNGDYSSWLQKTPGAHRVPETSRILHDLLYHNPALNVEIKPINKYRLSNIFKFDQGILRDPYSNKPMDINNWVDEEYLQKFNEIHAPEKPKEEVSHPMQNVHMGHDAGINERKSRTPVDPSMRPSSQSKLQRPPSSDVIELKQRSSSQQLPRHSSGSSNQLTPSQEHRPRSSLATRDEVEKGIHTRPRGESPRPKSRHVEDPSALSVAKSSSSRSRRPEASAQQVLVEGALSATRNAEDSNTPPAIKRSKRSEAGSPKTSVEETFRAHRDESPRSKLSQAPAEEALRSNKDLPSKIKDRSKDPSRQRPEGQSSSRHKEHHRSHNEGEHHSKSIPVTSSTTPVDPNRSHHRQANSGSGTPSRNPENPDSSAHRRDPEHGTSSKHSREYHEHHRSKRSLEEGGQQVSKQRQESKSSSKHRAVDEREYNQAKKSRSGHATPDTTLTQHHEHQDPDRHRSNSSKSHSERHQSSKSSRPRDPNDPRAHKQHRHEGGSDNRRHRDPNSSSSSRHN